MTKAGDVFENPATGERVVVRVGTEETAGTLLVADLYIRPGGAVLGEHIHPALEERFTVRRGALASVWTGTRTSLSPADSSCRLPASPMTGGMPVTKRRTSWLRSARQRASKR